MRDLRLFQAWELDLARSGELQAGVMTFGQAVGILREKISFEDRGEALDACVLAALRKYS